SSPGKRSATGERFPGCGITPLPGYGPAQIVGPTSIVTPMALRRCSGDKASEASGSRPWEWNSPLYSQGISK
ncbi:hypothetical protein, partial [Klebsiella electrica]|uniref:hypothetical protein n=1 Tax=Klebsiella electrica TaxID=1259973 RepID=UPI003F75A24C